MEEFFSSTFIILIFFPTFIINKKINLMAYIYIYHLFFWRKKGAYWFFWPLSVSWPQFSGAINWIPQSTSPIFPFLFYLIMKKEKRKNNWTRFVSGPTPCQRVGRRCGSREGFLVIHDGLPDFQIADLRRLNHWPLHYLDPNRCFVQTDGLYRGECNILIFFIPHFMNQCIHYK